MEIVLILRTCIEYLTSIYCGNPEQIVLLSGIEIPSAVHVNSILMTLFCPSTLKEPFMLIY